ncbi:cysteine--tRNA ligase [Devosia sp. XJ19-1]|uniref:Cysteine--tRNA ligase n=1 Tax=Devosia ureilytica TaxID=2952754 RepID=A0A9Q4AP54_9HYPH|nr:cysteine--tRNA ligase [Devosia ureilytica]MCP8884195.1 cysteine--tRNA ligase [Devosia ureilytica]MCP8887803.1 cysteine--tRNA ligase [Devosia ureilytica]
MTTAKPQLSLYNTLTRSKVLFVPEDANNVRLYACGPTVYDFAHIGNGRAAIVFDLLFRVLRHTYGADHVTYVRNITDVDDKINARALRDHPDLPLNAAIRKVTETTAAQYQKDTAALGCLEPTIQPRATENIDEMQKLIGSLLQRGHAYEAGGEVLFAVDSMPDYGQLSGRNLEDNLAGARVAVETHKRNPADFVLWKLSSAEEPGWDSPWGRGRPGWHIECSAMSERYLGETFDIHGGGLDLIFPHHENEIAQSRCAHGSHAMANVWMHNGFLQVEGQKMSKSLGNFFTIHDLLETEAFGGRKWPGEVLRLAMLMTHYREPIDFSQRRLEEAVNLLEKWERAAADAEPATEVSPDLVERLADDLDTSGAIARIHALIMDEGRAADGLALAGLMGITVKRDVQVDGAVATQVSARLAALNAKDFAEADRIRNDLAAQGIALMDYKDETGARQTKWEVKR